MVVNEDGIEHAVSDKGELCGLGVLVLSSENVPVNKTKAESSLARVVIYVDGVIK